MMAAPEITALRGELRTDEPLSRHTTWRTGGPATRFYRPADADDLATFLAGLPPEEPLLWLGLGSNLLVRDGGFPGTVIATTNRLADLEWLDATTLRAGAGVPCAKLARFAGKAGMTGGEFWGGIPGTLGGALAMNAGAFGGETWDRVVAVETVDHAGERRRRTPVDYEVGYRHVRGPEGEWFTAAELALEPGGRGREGVRELLEQRGATQPVQEATAGSTFRNPPGDHAARLLETAGLKGVCVGGACVSAQHANFIINTGTATSADIEALMEYMAERVRAVHGVVLEPEVRVAGVAA